MIETSKILLQTLARQLADVLCPSRWELTIDDAVRALARVTGSPALDEALAPIRLFLEGASSGAALDLAYGAPDAATELHDMCLKLAAEVDRERDWLAKNPCAWASHLTEVRDVLAEFDSLDAELRRIAAAVC